MRAIVLHNIVTSPVDPFDRAGSRTPARRFAEMVDGWRQHHDIVGFADAMASLTAPRPRGGKPPLLLTFDDGFAGVHDVALPILRERGLVGVAFVLTEAGAPIAPNRLLHFEELELAFRHSPRRDVDASWLGLGVYTLETVPARVRALREVKRTLKRRPAASHAGDVARVLSDLEVDLSALARAHALASSHRKMSAAEIRTLINEGWTIGGHTRTHPVLSRVDDAALAGEVGGNARDLAVALGLTQAPFAYPSGGPDHIDARAVAAVRDAGFSCAFTTTPGDNTVDTDRFQLRRFSATDVQMHTLGWPTTAAPHP